MHLSSPTTLSFLVTVKWKQQERMNIVHNLFVCPEYLQFTVYVSKNSFQLLGQATSIHSTFDNKVVELYKLTSADL